MRDTPPDPPSGASHDGFDPKAYLRRNYSRLDYDGNEAFLGFLVDAYRDLRADDVFLEFGGGPALCSPLAAARAREIHFCDYLEANLAEIRAWLRGSDDAFDWRPFIRKILEIEVGRAVDEQAVLARAEAVRSKLRLVGRCDATAAPPLTAHPQRRYDAVGAHFVINAAARSRTDVLRCLANVCSLLRPGGLLVLTSSCGRSRYRVGRRIFRLVPITADELVAALEALGFPASERQTRFVPSTAYGKADGYVFVRARKAARRDGDLGAATQR